MLFLFYLFFREINLPKGDSSEGFHPTTSFVSRALTNWLVKSSSMSTCFALSLGTSTSLMGLLLLVSLLEAPNLTSVSSLWVSRDIMTALPSPWLGGTLPNMESEIYSTWKTLWRKRCISCKLQFFSKIPSKQNYIKMRFNLFAFDKVFLQNIFRWINKVWKKINSFIVLGKIFSWNQWVIS